MKQWAKKWGISLLAILLAAIFPAIFLYASNSNEADFSEILLPAGGLCCNGYPAVRNLVSFDPSYGKVRDHCYSFRAAARKFMRRWRVR